MDHVNRTVCGYLRNLLASDIGRNFAVEVKVMSLAARLSDKPAAFGSMESLSAPDLSQVFFAIPDSVQETVDESKNLEAYGTYAAKHIVSDQEAFRLRIQDLRKSLAIFLDTYAADDDLTDKPGVNIGYAQSVLGLDDVDAKLLIFATYAHVTDAGHIRGKVDTGLHKLLRSLKKTCNPIDIIAACLGLRVEQVADRLASSAPLSVHGLLWFKSNMEVELIGTFGCWTIPLHFERSLWKKYDNKEEWTAGVLGRKCSPNLLWTDYEHLGPVREVAAAMLRGLAMAPEHESKAGVHILLIGPPGTGKTELASCLAAEVGRSLWSVGESDCKEDVKPPNRNERVSMLALSSRLLKSSAEQHLLLLDEAEDVLVSPPTDASNRQDFSKASLNRMLETNPVPIIWTANSLSQVDGASLRRMTLVIEMDMPERDVMMRIWKRAGEQHGLVMADTVAAHLIREWKVSPAVAATALRVSSLVRHADMNMPMFPDSSSAGSSHSSLEVALDGINAAMDGSTPAPHRSGDGFDPELVNASMDMSELMEMVSRPGTGRGWSLLLHGVTGTGKSLYARRLAEVLGIQPLFYRASDLLGPFQGETERKIAKMFSNARRKRAMLILDEGDTMLMDRERASSGADVSRVNEMLTWLEDHPQPFVCSTNLLSHIDAAAKRRMTFKVELRALNPRVSGMAFERLLGRQCPHALPDGLVPGDFHAVRKKAAILSESDPWTLYEWLMEELESRAGKRSTVGFHAISVNHDIKHARVINRLGETLPSLRPDRDGDKVIV